MWKRVTFDANVVEPPERPKVNKKEKKTARGKRPSEDHAVVPISRAEEKWLKEHKGEKSLWGCFQNRQELDKYTSDTFKNHKYVNRTQSAY